MRVDAQDGQVGGGVAAHQGGGHGFAVGETDLQVLVALHHVVGSDDQAIGAVDDAAGCHAAPAIDAHHVGAGAFDQAGHRGGKGLQYFRHGLAPCVNAALTNNRLRTA